MPLDRRESSSPLLADAVGALLRGGVLAVAVVRDERIEVASPEVERVFGLGPGGAPGRRVADLVAEPDRERVATAVGAPAGLAPVKFQGLGAGGVPFEGELVVLAADLAGAPARVLLVTDVTERRRSEAQLSALAFTDPVTGLPNRALLLDRLRQLLAESRRIERRFAILAIDLDGFKEVNDRFGHDAGDVVLQTVGRRLAESVREADTVARVGGDELTVLLSHISKRDDAALVAARMIRALEQPVVVPGGSCTVGASVGIVTYPEDGGDFDALLASADAAMYESKRGGKNRYTFSAAPGLAPEARRPPFLVWSATHHVGVASMDGQHRDLVERANRLGDALKAGRGPAELGVLFADLVAFTAAHFADEERLMAELPPHPSFERHRQIHRALLEDVRSLAIHVDETSMMLTMRYLQEWLFRHVDTMDRLLAEVLTGASASSAAAPPA